MHFVFNEHKAAQMAARLLHMAGGEMDHLKLMKLMYLADRQHLIERNRPISGDTYVSMKLGPVLSKSLDLIHYGSSNVDSPWSRYITPSRDYKVFLVQKDEEPANDELSRRELRVIDEVFEAYGSWDKFNLASHTHEICPEWEDPGAGSNPIDPADILREAGVSDQAIMEIARDIDAQRFIPLLQGSGA